MTIASDNLNGIRGLSQNEIAKASNYSINTYIIALTKAVDIELIAIHEIKVWGDGQINVSSILNLNLKHCYSEHLPNIKFWIKDHERQFLLFVNMF